MSEIRIAPIGTPPPDGPEDPAWKLLGTIPDGEPKLYGRDFELAPNPARQHRARHTRNHRTVK